MKSTVSLDIRIANYIARKLNGYVAGKNKKQSLRSETAWKEKFKGGDHIIFDLGEGIRMKLYSDSFLSKFIYDGFEKDEIHFLSHYLEPGDTFIDIGANVGLFSLYASKIVGPRGSVVAFEPSGVTNQRLLENVGLNGLENVTVHKMGLSDKSAILELNISVNGYEAWNTFVQSEDNKFSKKEQVPVKAFDAFCVEHSLDTDKISLIKLDVEGFEMNVLNGATGLLSKSNAPVFMVEFTDPNAIASGHCCHEIYKFLNGYDYRWYTYAAELKELTFDALRESYPYNNLIAVKDTNRNRVAARFSIKN